jgi:hypothetical protein
MTSQRERRQKKPCRMEMENIDDPTPHRRSRAHRDNRDTITDRPTETLGRRGNASVSPVPERLTVALLARAAVVESKWFALLGRPYCDLGSCGVEYST